MRLFVAVEIPKEIKDYLWSLQKYFTNEISVIKWVAKKNLHLTLKFLGEVDEEKLPKIKEALSYVKFEPFKVKLTNFGIFPSESNIRVLWVGLEGMEVFDIQEEVDIMLSEMFPKEKEFASHITLGRAKAIKDKQKFLDLVKKIKIEPLEFEISKISLIKSELTKDGSKYIVLN